VRFTFEEFETFGGFHFCESLYLSLLYNIIGIGTGEVSRFKEVHDIFWRYVLVVQIIFIFFQPDGTTEFDFLCSDLGDV